MIEYSQVKDPKWADAEHTTIDCMVDFGHLDDEFVPFTAMAASRDAHVVEIFERCVAGDFGDVAAYTSPPPPTREQKVFTERRHRDRLLSDLDKVTSNPLRWDSFTPEKQQEYAVYRQALLDVPQQATFPENIVWPTPPQ